MERFCQWAWDRHGPRYSWVMCVLVVVVAYPIYLLLALAIAALENDDRYAEAAAVAGVGVLVIAYATVLPGLREWRLVERWAAGECSDPAVVLQATYTWARTGIIRAMVVMAVCVGLIGAVVALMAGAPVSRVVQYGIVGAVFGSSSHLIGVHTVSEGPMRPVRISLTAATPIGDSLPRTRPTFADWSNLAMLAAALAFSLAGAMLAAVLTASQPMAWLAIAFALTLGFGVPITVGTAFAPSLRPIRDLAGATKRVAAGDFSKRLPVVQDDDLGALSASFNRMQAGLAERQRLQVAFGTYVDPVLAGRLLEQGDDVFTGERREVTVMFIDVRDFTPFAEANTAEDTVTRLNELFQIVVPAVVDDGGHVNKFLGDGAMAVFGAPNDLAGHAGVAVSAAVRIQRLVAERFGGELRIGIGINTGVVIAGTLGGAGHLEFTLIGDTVNVASRVEQLTKITGDPILLTEHTLAALVSAPSGVLDRGVHLLKGKSVGVRVFGLPRTHGG
jgi:adenylate cyclase